MADDVQSYKIAEQAFLASEGIEDAAELFVDLDRTGGQVRLLEVGPGSGRPVIFVPGVMTTGVVFAGLVSRLEGFRCLLLDRPGTGLSPPLDPPPDNIYSQRQVGDTLIVDIVDGLNLDKADVVCTSMGGYTAFRSAAAFPERIGRICALAYQVGARITDAPLAMRLPALSFLLPKRIKATRGVVASMLKSAGMRDAIDSGKFSDEMLDWMVALLRYTGTFGYESRYNPRPAGIAGPDPTVPHSAELLSKVTSPVHLFWGDNDIMGDESSATEFAGRLPNAELQMVEGAGHAPWLDKPELAADAVTNHLRRSSD